MREPKKALTAPSALFPTLLCLQVLLLLPAHPDVTDFNVWRNESDGEADAAPEQDFCKTQYVATINAAELPGLLRALSWRRVVVVVGSHRCLSQVLKCCCPFNLSQIKFVNERRNAAGQATEKSLTWFS